MSRLKVAVAIALIPLGAFIGWQVLSEPSYKGKTLSTWFSSFESYAGTDIAGFVDWLDPDGRAEIEKEKDLREVVQHIGTKAVPTLLRLVGKEDSAWKRRVMDWLEEHNFTEAHYIPASSWNEAGGWGFQVLGTNGASAVPALIKIASGNGSSYSRAAAICSLGWIGPAAKRAAPYLLQRATDTNVVPGDAVSAALRRAAKDALIEIDPETAARAGLVDPTWPERR